MTTLDNSWVLLQDRRHAAEHAAHLEQLANNAVARNEQRARATLNTLVLGQHLSIGKVDTATPEAVPHRRYVDQVGL